MPRESTLRCEITGNLCADTKFLSKPCVCRNCQEYRRSHRPKSRGELLQSLKILQSELDKLRSDYTDVMDTLEALVAALSDGGDLEEERRKLLGRLLAEYHARKQRKDALD